MPATVPPDDPFWPPPPDELEQVILGEHPYLLIQVTQGPVPRPGGLEPYVLEVSSGGGLGDVDVLHLLGVVQAALHLGDMGIAQDGTLLRRASAPPST